MFVVLFVVMFVTNSILNAHNEVHSRVRSLSLSLLSAVLQRQTDFSQGFYSRWGQLAHLTKLQSFISKRNRQNGNIDKQNHHQKIVGKLPPCLGST